MYKILSTDHKEYGPATAAEIRQWIGERRVHENTLAQAVGTTSWQALRLFPEFSSDFAAGPPPFSGGVGARYAEQPANSMATFGLVLSCVALICCGGCAPIALLGIIFSAVGLTDANRHPAQPGKGMAIAGLVIGIISLLGAVIGTIATMFFGGLGAWLEGMQR
jgi:hypothetical protein